MIPCDLIVFDMDGVLVDSSPCHAAAFARLWERCALSGPPYARIAGRSTREVVAEYTAALNPSAAEIDAWVAFKQTEARALLTSHTIVYDDTIPALTALRRAGVALAVATGASRETARLLLCQAELDRYFPIVATADDVRRGKPAPDLYAHAISQAGADPSRCVVVEDSAAGIEAGLAAGARVSAVRTGLTADHPAFAGSFASLAALAAFLLESAA